MLGVAEEVIDHAGEGWECEFVALGGGVDVHCVRCLDGVSGELFFRVKETVVVWVKAY